MQVARLWKSLTRLRTLKHLDIDLLYRCHENAMKHNPGYSLGGKPPSLSAHANQLEGIDCSGYVRWLLYRATDGRVQMPDGSWFQEQWCQGGGFKKTSYLLHGKLRDNRLRIAFIRASGKKVGHVWLIHNGRTIESYGGKGPGSRWWLTPALLRGVTSCYVLTEPLQR